MPKPEREEICLACYRPYRTTGSVAKFCSRSCGHSYRYKLGNCQTQRVCAVCSRLFDISRWQRTKCCSGHCGHILAQQTIKARKEASA